MLKSPGAGYRCKKCNRGFGLETAKIVRVLKYIRVFCPDCFTLCAVHPYREDRYVKTDSGKRDPLRFSIYARRYNDLAWITDENGKAEPGTRPTLSKEAQKIKDQLFGPMKV